MTSFYGNTSSAMSNSPSTASISGLSKHAPAMDDEETGQVPKEIIAAIDSLKLEVQARRLGYIQKIMEENGQKLSGATLKNEKRNVTSSDNDNGAVLLIKRQTDAVTMQIGKPTDARRAVCCRSQEIYYDQSGGEALICRDSEEEVIEEEENKKEFARLEDYLLRMAAQQVGLSDAALELLGQCFSKKPCDVKARQEALCGEGNAKAGLKIWKELRILLTTCFAGGVILHECSQDLIFPTEKLHPWIAPEVANKPCGLGCYCSAKKSEGIASVDSQQFDDPLGTLHTILDDATVQVSARRKSNGSGKRKGKYAHSDSASSNARNASDSCDSDFTSAEDNSIDESSIQLKSKSNGKSGASKNKSKRAATPILVALQKNTVNQDSDSVTRGGNMSGDMKLRPCTRKSREDTGSSSPKQVESSDDEKSKTSLSAVDTSKVRKYEVHCGFLSVPVTNQYTCDMDDISRKELVDENPCKQEPGIDKSWKALEKALYEKGLEIFGRNSLTRAGAKLSGKQCPCLLNGTCCEKYCGCPKSCKHRFRGCHCAKSQCRSRQCPCFAADRECDPDVCCNCWVSCGDGTLGTPNQRGDNYECRNMKLLLKQQQRVLLGRSDVSGWGAFLKNNLAKHEYLGEYTGETISHREADKRGKIYDRENSSFLFNLNDWFVLDAYRKGDKLKFANHSPNPNCYAKVILVGGDHRVGIFAKEELFYDYRYEADRTPAWARKPELA